MSEAIHIGDTHFECVVHAELDMMSDCTRFAAVFSLNGNKRTVKHSCRIRSVEDEIKAMEDLRDKIARSIATEMILSAFSQIKFAQRFGNYE